MGLSKGRIDRRLLAELSKHTRSLGLKRFLRGMGYERCAELPLVLQHLRPTFDLALRHLDIGSGDSILPTFLLQHSKWDITCLDKFSSVKVQHTYCRKVIKDLKDSDRFHVVEADFLQNSLPEGSFDVITNISVIEHFEGNTDEKAMEQSARLLKPGGKYLLSTLVNEGHFREFRLRQNVYGSNYTTEPVFFQRHHDVESFNKRVVRASGMKEIHRQYFGEYGFQFLEHFLDIGWPWKPVKLLYQWQTPAFARRFITYSPNPVSKPDMPMYTASGVFVVLEKTS